MLKLPRLLDFVVAHNGINDKSQLAALVVKEFGLTKDRKVYYCDEFAIRFSSSAGPSFSNTILSLSNLKKVDHIPFLVCLVTPTRNHIWLANTTFLRMISHSSQELRVDNIKGSFNGSDILRELEGIENIPSNLDRLFSIHAAIGFEGNLTRLVDATNNITPSGKKFDVTVEAERVILEAPARAERFVASPEAVTLKKELDDKVARYKNEIILAALIENVNVRGRVIEYLIAGEDENLRKQIILALQGNDTTNGLPRFKTDNALGDYQRIFDDYFTETDVKTKIMVLSSNPKGYNLDKMLEFLATEKSVFMFYFIGVDPTRIVNTILLSTFQCDLMGATILLKHWSGRNSRGVSQFEGNKIAELIMNPRTGVNRNEAEVFLKKLIAL